MDNKVLKDELLKKLKDSTQSNNIEFTKKIPFSGSVESPTLFLDEKWLNKNMQDDGGAFEGWVIALLALAHCEQVAIRWDRIPVDNPHYQRFLYRVAFFSELFPELSLSEENREDVERRKAKASDICYVNVPKTEAALQAKDREAILERSLINEVMDENTESQFPCGVFCEPGEPKEVNKIFPGRRAAMDIVRVSKDTIFVYELKERKNKSIGIVSELMFYTSILRDLCRGRMEFARHEQSTRCAKSINAISSGNIRNVEAVFLVEDGNFHPLLQHPDYLERLNKGAARFTEPAFRFRKARFTVDATYSCSGIEYV